VAHRIVDRRQKGVIERACANANGTWCCESTTRSSRWHTRSPMRRTSRSRASSGGSSVTRMRPVLANKSHQTPISSTIRSKSSESRRNAPHSVVKTEKGAVCPPTAKKENNMDLVARNDASCSPSVTNAVSETLECYFEPAGMYIEEIQQSAMELF